MANFEAINIFWNQVIEDKNQILDVKYEDLVEKPEVYLKRIYEFLEIKSDYSEVKRKNFFSHTASIRQIGSEIHKKSVKKEEFLSFKGEFIESLQMQRKYWEKRGLFSEEGDFFGYKLS